MTAISSRRLVRAIKACTPPILYRLVYQKLIVRGIEGASRYQPQYSPWLEAGFQKRYKEIAPHTLVTPDRCWYLSAFAQQAMSLDGCFMEAGAYRGGTALLLRQEIESAGADRKFYILDSFSGMLQADAAKDRHKAGDFSDTSLATVQRLVGSDSFIDYRKGWIPDTFHGLETECFAFAHIDLDLYQSVKDCCEFIYPRLAPGGLIVFDDYGFPNTPGARLAVDEFFAKKLEVPIALGSGQAVVCKLP
jgi:O-methyltransferase